MELYRFDPIEDGYPSFAALFKPHADFTTPPYLSLLNLQPWNWEEVLAAIRMVRHSVRDSPDAQAEIAALFRKDAWRSHLVGAVVVSMGFVSSVTLSALWQAFDTGSWVSPQLAVAAFLHDAAFEDHARSRIIDGYTEYTSKSLAALVALCRTQPTQTAWLEAALTNETRREAITDAWDRGDEIALDWLRNIRAALADSRN